MVDQTALASRIRVATAVEVQVGRVQQAGPVVHITPVTEVRAASQRRLQALWSLMAVVEVAARPALGREAPEGLVEVAMVATSTPTRLLG